VLEKEWRIPLFGASYIVVWVLKNGGRVENFSVVLINDGECVTRYDCAHQMPHRDVLGRKSGLIRKEFWDMSKKEALEHALADFKRNSEQYIAFYESR
jgi:hypothetical protein